MATYMTSKTPYLALCAGHSEPKTLLKKVRAHDLVRVLSRREELKHAVNHREKESRTYHVTHIPSPKPLNLNPQPYTFSQAQLKRYWNDPAMRDEAPYNPNP